MLNPTATTTVTSTVASTAQLMSIDAEGMGTVLSILSTMYSDGALAVVREYSCNALDSHVEAGNPDPILVTSPTLMNPRLVVQDFGVGLSQDEMLNVYARYGASTKRNSNDQIGAFGIGAKSAFTVGTQFIVTAVKDGEKTVALFALNENGAPTVNIVFHDETDEPNGVKVDIAVSDVDAINDAIDRLFPTWTPGTVMVDGVQPVSLWTTAEELEEDIHIRWLKEAFSGESIIVVMGGVPYKLNSAVMNSLNGHARRYLGHVPPTKLGVVFTVPIGAVDITPSREELKVTPKTIGTVEGLVGRFQHAFQRWVNEKVKDAPSFLSALIMKNKLRGKVNSMADVEALWNGKPLSGDSIRTPLTWMQLAHKRGSCEKVARRHKDLELHVRDDLDKMLFVTDVPERRIRSVQLASKAYLIENSEFNRVVAVTQPSFAYGWFDISDVAITTMGYEDFIAKWKPKAADSGRNSASSAIFYYVMGQGLRSLATLKNSKTPLAFMLDSETRLATLPFFPTAVNDYLVIQLSNRQTSDALRKRLPGATRVLDLVKVEARKVLTTVTTEDLNRAIAKGYTAGISLPGFFVRYREHITNPVIVKALAEHDEAVKMAAQFDSVRHNSLLEAVALLDEALDVSRATFSSPDTDWDGMLKTLPLLQNFEHNKWGITNIELATRHLIDYINSTTL